MVVTLPTAGTRKKIVGRYRIGMVVGLVDTSRLQGHRRSLALLARAIGVCRMKRKKEEGA